MNSVVKIITGIVVAGFFVTKASAQNTNLSDNQKPQQVTTQDRIVQGVYIDKDKNGVCDNFESGRKIGRGRNFVDTNGDSICDNRGSNWKNGNGRGNNRQCGYRNCRRGNHGKGHGYCRRGSIN